MHRESSISKESLIFRAGRVEASKSKQPTTTACRGTVGTEVEFRLAGTVWISDSLRVRYPGAYLFDSPAMTIIEWLNTIDAALNRRWVMKSKARFLCTENVGGVSEKPCATGNLHLVKALQQKVNARRPEILANIRHGCLHLSRHPFIYNGDLRSGVALSAIAEFSTALLFGGRVFLILSCYAGNRGATAKRLMSAHTNPCVTDG